MSNPFTMHGPQFLNFYFFYAVACLAGLYLWRLWIERASLPPIETTDPYLFAYLNRGPAEVVRVATVGLIDRGLIKLVSSTGYTEPNLAADPARPAIENKLLEFFREGQYVTRAWADSGLLAQAHAAYERRLRQVNLLPDARTLRLRLIGLVAAFVALIGVGVTKIAVALSIGRTNIVILVAFMVIAVIFANRIWNPFRTSIGTAYLNSVRGLFSGLHARGRELRPGGATRELLWLTALFGAAALPSALFPVVAYAWPTPAPNTGAAGCGGGSSSGGSCGGGGGGCGGCGS